FFVTPTALTDPYPLSLHDALPICLIHFIQMVHVEVIPDHHAQTAGTGADQAIVALTGREKQRGGTGHHFQRVQHVGEWFFTGPGVVAHVLIFIGTFATSSSRNTTRMLLVKGVRFGKGHRADGSQNVLLITTAG